MPILIIEHDGKRRAGVLRDRVLIGRRNGCGLVIGDTMVSRLHAWIDPAGKGEFLLCDCGSRFGTFVNGNNIAHKRLRLQHRDEIRIGEARITYRTDNKVPAGCEQVSLANDPAKESAAGILFDCACGAPLWVSASLAGKFGQCQHCHQTILIPRESGMTAGARQTTSHGHGTAANGHADAEHVVCSICQTAVTAGEETTNCPECGLQFHKDCWAENFGCSAYGCTMVNALLEQKDASPAAADDPAPPEHAEPESADALALEEPPPVPWEILLLAASVVGSIIGALMFGLPALATGVAGFLYFGRNRSDPPRARLALASVLLSAVGMTAGVAASYYWWLT